MKFIKVALLFSTVLLTSAAHADFIGANLEFGVFTPETNFHTESSSDFNYEDKPGTYFSADIQHPFPLIPNARVDVWSFKTTGTSGTSNSTLEVNTKDITGYYALNLLWFGIEGGISARNVEIDYSESGTNKSASNDFLPMVYLSAKVSLPGTETQLAIESKRSIALDPLSDLHLIDESEDSVKDIIYKIAYQPIPIIGIELGYIDTHQKIGNATLNNSAYFVGLTIDI